MRTTLIFLVAVLTASIGFSQQLDLQAGIRTGVSNGLTCRILTGPVSYTEGMLLSRNRGVQLYVLRGETVSVSKIPIEGFSYSSAWGGHVGFTGSTSWRNENQFRSNIFMPVIGIDYYMALNFTLRNFPITFSVDYKPFVEIVPDRILRMNLWDFGFTVRYQFTTKI